MTNGNIVRAWQPFNGLQIFDPNEGITYTADTSMITEAPPNLCKKGGATMRIKCDDDGRYHPDAEMAASPDDLRRAHTKIPRVTHRGVDHADMSLVLNRWLNTTDVDSKECAYWSVGELRDFIRLLHRIRHDDLDRIYAATFDKRSMKKDAETRWDALDVAHAAEGLGQDTDLYRVHRDGLCHEAVMLYVHHLTEEVRANLGRKTKVPLLSYRAHGRDEHAPSAAADHTFKLYEEHVTCASCHSDYTPPAQEVVV